MVAFSSVIKAWSEEAEAFMKDFSAESFEFHPEEGSVRADVDDLSAVLLALGLHRSIKDITQIDSVCGCQRILVHNAVSLINTVFCRCT